MSEPKLFGPERKPYESPIDDRLAPSSYGAGAVFGVVEMAVKEIYRNGQDLTPAAVGAWSTMLSRIIIKAQLELGEAANGWHAFLNTRLRGALYTALEVVEANHPGDAEHEADLQRLVISIAKTAAWLYAKHPRELVEG